MTREEAIQVLKEIPNCHIREYEYDSRGTLGSKVSALLRISVAIDMAIEALQAEPIERISDNTIVVKYADYEDIGRIILTNGDIFCKMFYEDNTQEDDNNYDSLIPDEYKTEPSDLISRADAVKAIKEFRQSLPCADENDENFGHDVGMISGISYVERHIIPSLPSADRPSGKWQQVEIIDDDEPSGVNTNASECSVCGVIQQSHYWATHYYSYCPNCGARMENTK